MKKEAIVLLLITIFTCSGFLRAQAPVAQFSQSATSACAGTGVNYTDLSTNNPTSWSWTFPGGTPGSSTQQNPSGITWSSAGTKTVTLVATNASGSSTITHTITIKALPNVSTTASPTTICQGSSSTLTGSGANSYVWQPGNLSGSPVTVYPMSTTTYTVTGTSTVTGCSNSATRTITVNPSPTVVATASSTTLCSGSSTTLSASGGNSYTWNPGNHNGANWTVTPASTITYTVTGTGSAGCTGTSSITITVNAIPTVSVSASASTICSGNSTTLTASGATTYTWAPGSLAGNPLTLSPGSTTTYTVTGTTAGCTASATKTITVNTSPTVTVSASSDTICAGNNTTLSVNGANSYSWMPGNLSGNSVAVSPSLTTTYTVTGTAANGCTSVDSNLITVNPVPVVAVTATDTVVCFGGMSTLSASGANSYVWMPGNTGGASAVVMGISTTTYTVTGTDLNGCTGTATQQLTVLPAPVVTASATSTLICAGTPTQLHANGASSYSWNPGNLPGSPASASPLVSTTYTVTGTAANGCTGTATVSIVVNDLPSVTALASPGSICAGDAVTLSASGASTYIWQPLNANSASISDTPSATTTYSVTGTDGNGCTNSGTVTVVVNPLPTILAIGDTLICPGATATLSGTGGSTYTWQPGNILGSTVYVTPSAPTTYSVTGVDVNGCTGSSTISVSIDTPPSLPVIIVNGSTLSASVTAFSYQWFLDGNPISGATAQSYMATQTGTFTVEAYDAAGCGSGQAEPVVNPTGIETFSASNFISVSPNPNDGNFILAFSAAQPADYLIEIRDVTGRVIYSETLSHFSGDYRKSIDLHSTAKGVYSVRIGNEHQQDVKRIVVD